MRNKKTVQRKWSAKKSQALEISCAVRDLPHVQHLCLACICYYFNKKMCVLLRANLAFIFRDWSFIFFCWNVLRKLSFFQATAVRHDASLSNDRRTLILKLYFFRVFYDQGGPILNTSIKVLFTILAFCEENILKCNLICRSNAFRIYVFIKHFEVR